MPASNLWRQYAVPRTKIVVLAACVWVSVSAHAQLFRWARQHNPNYNERFISYGFVMGGHTSGFRLQYSDRFVTQDFDTVHSVITPRLPGFSLGFLVNMRLNSNLDLRLMPKAGFYNHQVEYRYTNRTVREQLVETTLMEFPLLLKYKSARRGNVRMYMLGGVTPGFEMSGQNDAQGGAAGLGIRKRNFGLDAGIGFDFYFPLFKFSQEIRFTRGVANMLAADPSPYSEPISRLNTDTIAVYFIFQ